MKIYDISQQVFGCAVFPGDKAPKKYQDKRMDDGDLYNLTSFFMCAHNGTHIDAPFHFLQNGATVEQIPLEKTVGYCFVTRQERTIEKEQAEQILQTAQAANAQAVRRILIKGKGVVSVEAAQVFAQAGVWLVGVEEQTVGPSKAPMAVHKILLNANTTLLEGLRLADIKEGVYFLSAAPLCLNGCDGAPCRALLIQE